jgi:hypothetical protein
MSETTDTRTIGLQVWLQSNKWGSYDVWKPITIEKVHKKYVDCSNGKSYNLAPGQTCGDNPVIDFANAPEPTNPNRFILADRALTPEQREEKQRLLRELWESDPFREPEIKSAAGLDAETRASIERGIEQAKAGDDVYLGSFADE